jgi:Tfp pilus assembly protein PilP
MRSSLVGLGVLLVVTGAFAQQSPSVVEEPAVDTSTVERILRGEEAIDTGVTFTYDRAGRRDPFRSLLGGRLREELQERPPGLRGMGVEEVRLQGVVQLPEGFVAMVQGTDNMSYLIRPGTVLWDGMVERVERDKVVFRLQVADPRSLRPYREVVRTLQ